MDFIAVDKFCLVRDVKTSKIYCIPDFDIETLKLFTFDELEELQKKCGKNAYSVTTYYYANDELIGNMTLSIHNFFINFDKLVRNNRHLSFDFKVNTTKLKDKLMRVYSKITR